MNTAHQTRHRIASRIAIILLCATSSFAAAPRDERRNPPPRPDRRDNRPAREQQRRDDRSPAQHYSIEQAISDQAQLHTIAFSGLAFITGDFGASTFLPPGKVCDYFGFQYMRDIDVQQAGHNPKFLGRVAGNVLATLNDQQRALLADLARRQAPRFKELATMRFPLIKAFHQQLAGQLPSGSQSLNEAAVAAHVGDIFRLDAELSYQRAEMYGQVAATLTTSQKTYFSRMKFGDFSSWPEVDGDAYRMPRGTEKMINVAYMTYASEFFSWYAGSIEADTYFCPERHGTYFGGFYMKDMPAMGKRDYNISTSLTGDSGKSFLELLNPTQRREITALPDLQRSAMRDIVTVRRQISTELRRFLSGQKADHDKVLALGQQYGRLDGQLSYFYAVAFAKVGQTLTSDQRAQANRLRNLDNYVSAPAYLYSSALTDAPDTRAAARLFFPPTPTTRAAR